MSSVADKTVRMLAEARFGAIALRHRCVARVFSPPCGGRIKEGGDRGSLRAGDSGWEWL